MSREAAAGPRRPPWGMRNLTRALTLACLASFSFLCLLFLAPIPPHIRHHPLFPPFHRSGSLYPQPPLRPRPAQYVLDGSGHPDDAPFPPDFSPSPCVGPRGTVVAAGVDFPQPVYELPNTTFATPIIGSLEAVGVRQSWLTARARYGPYGYEEDEPSYAFPRVDWPDVEMGRLQHDCVVANRKNLPGRTNTTFSNAPRFRLSKYGDGPEPPRKQTGRQAIVLRAWSTYEYTPEDRWNIRALVTEANLATGGLYEVILLVDVKDTSKGPYIHRDDQVYEEVLRDSVPPEFRDLAVLFHQDLQKDWYAKVREVRPIWQIMQPLQLFAHFYPEYDHYWQIELDSRFTGHAGEMLQAFHDFGRNEPYKQAAERSSWAYMPAIHGSYSDLAAAVNESLRGGATRWGPVRVPQIEPMFPAPPMRPKEDNFTWGVGVDADLLLLTSISDVRRIASLDDWVFKAWYSRELGEDPPRWISAPAQCRASWQLLESVHQAQYKTGLRLPSEATLPSHATWNGMKIVGIQHPVYQYPQRNIRELNKVFNGMMPQHVEDGFAVGPGRYRSSSVAFFMRPLTWSWWSSLPDPMYEHWFGREVKLGPGREIERPNPPSELPEFMANVSGSIYMPPMLLHPRKTNDYIG